MTTKRTAFAYLRVSAVYTSALSDSGYNRCMEETKTCTKCGVAHPATLEFFHKSKQAKSGIYPHCKVCHGAMMKAWRAAHREESRAIAQRWRHANAEQERERHRRARAADPEKHREKVRLSHRKHRHQHQEYDARRKAQMKGYPWEAVSYYAIYDRDWGQCHLCQRFVGRDVAEYDHIIPFAKGGGHFQENIAVSCDDCNQRKGRYLKMKSLLYPNGAPRYDGRDTKAT